MGTVPVSAAFKENTTLENRNYCYGTLSLISFFCLIGKRNQVPMYLFTERLIRYIYPPIVINPAHSKYVKASGSSLDNF